MKIEFNTDDNHTILRLLYTMIGGLINECPEHLKCDRPTPPAPSPTLEDVTPVLTPAATVILEDLIAGAPPPPTPPVTPPSPVETVAPPSPVETPPAVDPSLFATVAPPAPVETVAPPVVTVAPATGVELDSDGLPWDHRIHGKSKLKLQKTQQWKKIRGVDPTLVATVEAELRAVMAIPNASLAPPAVSPPPTAPIANTVVSTFGELLALITGNGFEASTVTAAVNKHGIESLALLAVRPDLIPAVAKELGL